MKIIAEASQYKGSLKSPYYKVVGDDFKFEVKEYVDVSTISNWHNLKVYKDSDMDYRAIRSEIKKLGLEKIGSDFSGWGELSALDKSILARYFIVPNRYVYDVFGMNDINHIAELFHINSKEARKRRMDKVVALLFLNLTKTDALDILTEIYNGRLYTNYVELGIEGKERGDFGGLFDYVQSVGVYKGKGLGSKKIVPVEGTLGELITNIMKILNHGKL